MHAMRRKGSYSVANFLAQHAPPSAVQKKISAPSRRRPRLTKGAINTGE
jgi:hypothetical protein